MPDPSEGFAALEVVPFSRVLPPEFTERAVIVWCDGVLRRSRYWPADAFLGRRRGGRARSRRSPPRVSARGWRVIGLSWQPEISDGTMSRSEVTAAFDRTRELLGLDLEVHICPASSRPSNLLVPQTAARAWRGRHRTSPARSRHLPLCRCRLAGSGVRAPPRLHVPARRRVFQRIAQGGTDERRRTVASTDRRGDGVRAGLRAGPLCAVCAACHRGRANSRRPARPRRRLRHGRRGAPGRGGGRSPADRSRRSISTPA